MFGVTIAMLVVVTMIEPRFYFYVDGFSTLPGVACFQNNNKAQLPVNTDIVMNTKTRTAPLFGILDDMMEEEEESGDAGEENNNNDDEQLVELYHSIIFATDLRLEISNRLEECTDPSFLEYLTASSNSSQDKEERQGLTELIDQIDEVKTTMAMKAAAAAADQEKADIAAKEQEEEESETIVEIPAKRTKPMSNADVLRKANEIDAAIALSDEEKPSDFISDCREVVNLSRGFNDSGKMSVGG